MEVSYDGSHILCLEMTSRLRTNDGIKIMTQGREQVTQ